MGSGASRPTRAGRLQRQTVETSNEGNWTLFLPPIPYCDRIAPPSFYIRLTRRTLDRSLPPTTTVNEQSVHVRILYYTRDNRRESVYTANERPGERSFLLFTLATKRRKKEISEI